MRKDLVRGTVFYAREISLLLAMLLLEVRYICEQHFFQLSLIKLTF
jgi:hypothetical protein